MRFNMRTTPADEARMARIAAAQGCSRSEAVRLALLKADGTPLADVPDEDELVRLLGERARAGNVRAIEVLLRISERSTPMREPTSHDPFAEVDELARRRRLDR
jgi:hypothetical protein